MKINSDILGGSVLGMGFMVFIFTNTLNKVPKIVGSITCLVLIILFSFEIFKTRENKKINS